MKRNATIIIAAGLTSIVAITVFFLLVTSFISPTQASGSKEDEPSLLAPVNVEDMAQSTQTQNRAAQIEAAFKEREALLQAQIAERQQAITQLGQTSQAEINRLQSELANITGQTEQTLANIEATQAHLQELQQAIEQDGTTFENEVARLQNAEQELQQQLEVAYAQLQTAYDALAQQQAMTAAGPSGSPSSGGSYHDDDDSHHSDHDDDEDDHDDHDDEDEHDQEDDD